MEGADVPVIKTFLYKNKFYLYDCFVNRIFRITKEQYLEINELKKIGLQSYLNLNKSSREYNDILSLIDKGLFKSSFVKKIEHPETKYAKYLLSRCISDITLQVTKNCNFSCRYCMFANHNGLSRTHKDISMTWDVAKASLDFLFTHSKDAQQITIAFYGGEPMLNYNLIHKAVEYAESLFFTKSIKYLMTTNCSIMTEDMIAFLVKHNFDITLSFDGPQEIQNKHRRFDFSGNQTYDIVYGNICKIRDYSKEFFENNITFLPVFFEDENQVNIFHFFTELGVKENKIHKVLADLKGIDYNLNRGTLIEKSKLNEIENNKNIDIQYANIYTDKTEIPNVWHHNGPCIPGMQRLFVNTTGVFHICEKSMEDPHLSIGNIFEGIDIQKVIDFMNIGKLSEDQCKKCWAMRYCNICVMFCNDIEKKQLTLEKKLIACKQIKDDVLNYFERELIDKNQQG